MGSQQSKQPSDDLMLEVLRFTTRTQLDCLVIVSRQSRRLIDAHCAYTPLRFVGNIRVVRGCTPDTFLLYTGTLGSPRARLSFASARPSLLETLTYSAQNRGVQPGEYRPRMLTW